MPGQGEADLRDHVAAALGSDGRYELDLLEPLAGGTISTDETELYRLCAAYAAERAGAELLPIVSPGFSDSHWIRQQFGTVAYGFAPVFHTDPDLYLGGPHAADEALEVADLLEMTEFHLQALRAIGSATA
jgi:acetylornithine deacetylase/succinyl-diaminopimelate desuccinylase-like protein